MYGAHKRSFRRGSRYHQQPHGTDCRDPGPVSFEGALHCGTWSDSKYVIDSLSKGWAKGWKAKAWVKSDKKPALNPDLWDELLWPEGIHTLHYHGSRAMRRTGQQRCDETGGSPRAANSGKDGIFTGFCGHLWKNAVES